MKFMAMLGVVGIAAAGVGGAAIWIVWRWERRRFLNGPRVSPKWLNQHESRRWK